MSQYENAPAVARELAAQFETATRPDGSKFTRLRKRAPEWMKNAVRAAHAGKLPDDHTYQMASIAADYIAENVQSAYYIHELAEQSMYEVEGPTDRAALLAWVGSHSDRAALVDEAMEAGCETMDGAICFAWSTEVSAIAEALIAHICVEAIDRAGVGA